MEKVNVRRELAAIKEHWSQRTVGRANGQLFKLAKGIGETRWHQHDDQDELFLVYKGSLTIQLRDKDVELHEDELFVVPRGTEHCPKADQEVEFMIVGLSVTSNKAGGKPNLEEE